MGVHITVIAVGKLKEKYLKDGIGEYAKRLSRFCSLEIVEVEDEKAEEALSATQGEQVKRKEAERVFKRLKDGAVLVVMDVKGVKITSEGFADKLQGFFIAGSSHITFVIGGSLGLDNELVKRADWRLSLSDMTFPHQLARLVLLEQIYRGFKIMHGETYHK